MHFPHSRWIAKFFSETQIIQTKCCSRPICMTADNLMPLLETERDSAKLFVLASSLAQGDVPLEVVSWVRMGRITALRKEDILRRLVARDSQADFEGGGRIHGALPTRSVHEDANVWPTSSRHSLESDESATVVCVDGIGTFDVMSCNAMLEGFMGIDSAPF